MGKKKKSKKKKEKEEKDEKKNWLKQKAKFKPIMKKTKPLVVRIEQPRELPENYHSPYFEKEMEKERRNLFLS